jgi:hypothetical protein
MPNELSYQLKYDSDTDNTYKWTITVGKRTDYVYILKWRVPTPTPKFITVRIAKGKHDTIQYWTNIELGINPARALQPIKENMKFTSDHSHTYRYDTVDWNKNKAIVDIYIPKQFTFDKYPNLAVTVFWDY